MGLNIVFKSSTLESQEHFSSGKTHCLGQVLGDGEGRGQRSGLQESILERGREAQGEGDGQDLDGQCPQL